MAQISEILEEEEDETRAELQHSVPMQVITRHRFKCQVDGSWSEKDKCMGMGFILVEADVVILQGQKCTTEHNHL